MRTAFIDQLIKEAEKNDKIFLLVGDLGYNVVEPFANKFPERFRNVGIAEQNMAGVASGLAMCGFNVYIYSIGNFPTLRCIEQIRNDIAYHNANVKVIAVGGGFAYGDLGSTHHATETIGIMRSIPNIVVSSPCDPVETRKIISISSYYNGPMYIQLGKAGEQIVHQDKFAEVDVVGNLKIGDIIPVLKNYNEAKDTVFATGSVVAPLKEQILKNKVSLDLYSFPFIKPINETNLIEIVSPYSKIICIEEHQKSTGFGSAIIEHVSDLFSMGRIEKFPKIIRKAIADEFIYEVGSQNSLRKKIGLIL